MIWVTDGLFLIATLAMTTSVAGVLRLRGIYAKIHAASTAVIFAALALIAAGLAGDWVLKPRALLVIVFLLVTAPAAAHALARLQRKIADGDRRSGETGEG